MRTAMAPSPTAEATRRTAPLRTSPTAKTPGRLVSRDKGCRAAGQAALLVALARGARPGDDEAVLVELDLVIQPTGVGLGADEHEQGPRRLLPSVARRRLLDHDGLQRLVPDEVAHLCVGHHLDRGVVPNPIGEVPGHVTGQVIVAHEQAHLRRVPRQEQGRLPGRVPSANDDDRVADAHPGLDQRGRVVHARALEVLETPHVELAVARSGGDHNGARADGRPVVEPNGVVAVIALEPDGRGRKLKVGSELLGLDDGALGQFAAGKTGGKPEVVLDPRRRRGLSAAGDGVDHDGAQALGRAVHRGGQAGGPGTHDQQVREATARSGHGQADDTGQLGGARVAHDVAAVPHDDGGLVRRDPELTEQRLRGRSPRRG